MRKAVLTLACALLLRAQDPADKSSPAVAAGKAQFGQTCAFCHGPNARGASGPDLIRSALVSHDVDGNLIGDVVRNGRPSKGMPAFPLSDDQIHSLAAYLHSEAKQAATVARNVPEDYPAEKLLVGSFDAGKRYFNGPGGCTACHSVTGNLAHIATKYKPIDLQSRIAFPSGSVPTVTVTTPSGQVYTGAQVVSDEFLIALKDANGWVHTWNRNSVKVQINDPLAEHQRLLFTYSDENIHDLFAYLETLK